MTSSCHLPTHGHRAALTSLPSQDSSTKKKKQGYTSAFPTSRPEAWNHRSHNCQQGIGITDGHPLGLDLLRSLTAPCYPVLGSMSGTGTLTPPTPVMYPIWLPCFKAFFFFFSFGQDHLLSHLETTLDKGSDGHILSQ